MGKNNVIELEGREANTNPLIGLLQVGAHQLIEQAVEAELQELLAHHAARRTESGRVLVSKMPDRVGIPVRGRSTPSSSEKNKGTLIT